MKGRHIHTQVSLSLNQGLIHLQDKYINMHIIHTYVILIHVAAYVYTSMVEIKKWEHTHVV